MHNPPASKIAAARKRIETVRDDMAVSCLGGGECTRFCPRRGERDEPAVPRSYVVCRPVKPPGTARSSADGGPWHRNPQILSEISQVALARDRRRALILIVPYTHDYALFRAAFMPPAILPSYASLLRS